jgi:DNA (cytosine-5)-methyltransferase 1
MQSRKTPLVIDLFAGAGGMSEGFQQAGFRAAAAVEFDEMAARTFSFNHPDVPLIVGDIRNISPEQVLDQAGVGAEAIDVVCGGPPCQGFSLAGPRIADDPRNKLFLEFVRFVRVLKPRFFIFENVSGLTSMLGGAALTAIINEFTSLGYSCCHEVLNAADYGVPQSRPRFILIGSRDNEGVGMPERTHTGTRGPSLFDDDLPPHLTVWDALSDLPVIEAGQGEEELQHAHSPSNPYQNARRGRRRPGTLYNHRATGHSERIKARYAAIPEGSDNSCLPDELRTKKVNVFKLHRSRPARTVTCNHRTDLLHPVIPRGTTVREAARLQSFDDDYRFFGNLTRKARWVTQDDQVGNAVPPLLAQAIARHLAKAGSLFGAESLAYAS